MSPPQSERSRRRAPAACTPCRKRHVRCIWSPSEGSPVRCQRCRERELDCVYEPTSATGPPPAPMSPSLVPVSGQVSSYPPGSGLLHGRPLHAGMSPAYQPIYGHSNPFSSRQPGQGDNVNWNTKGHHSGLSFGHSPTQSQAPSSYYGSESWRMPGAQSLTPSSFHSAYSVSQTNAVPPYQPPSNASWPASPYASIDPHNDPFYDLLSQSPVHSNSQSPPMLDPPSRF